MTKHSPAPWEVDGIDREHGTFEIWSTKPETLICHYIEYICGPIDPEESLANSVLIATAPELLAALKGMVDAFGSWSDYAAHTRRQVSRAKKAIAKAEGQP